MTTTSVECPNCQQWYDPQTSKQLTTYACPNCRYQTTAFKNVRVNVTVGISAQVTEIETKNSYVRKNVVFDVIVLVLTICVPLAGYFLVPIIGTVLALSGGLVNYWLTPKAKKWFIETTRMSLGQRPLSPDR